MRRMVRPLRAPVPPCAAPLAVVSVMFSPFRDPSGPVAGLSWPCGSAGVLASVWCLRAARFTVLPRSPAGRALRRRLPSSLVPRSSVQAAPRPPARSLCPRALLLLVRGLHLDRGFHPVRRFVAGMAGVPRVVAFGTQRGYLFLEVGQRLNSALDRGDPKVGDLVKLAKRTQDRKADIVGRNLSATAAPDHVLYPLGQDSELILADGPALAGAPDAPDDLVPVEGLGDAAALGHHDDDRLLGREAAAARRARPPAADRCTVLGRPAVDDPAVRVPAVRAVHATHLPRMLASSLPPNTTHRENYTGVTISCGRSNCGMQPLSRVRVGHGMQALA